MMSADGFAEGSIDSRPSEDTEGVTSVSRVARSKNWRSADWRTLSYKAPTARAGGVDNSLDHNSAVQRNTLIDFFRDLADIRGEFLVYDDGYRRRAHSYEEVARAARGFAATLASAGFNKGDKVVFWGENRPEGVGAYLGWFVSGIIVVPMECCSSPGMVQ